MKTPALALLLLSAFLLSACENSEPVGPPQAGNESEMNVEENDAVLLINDLNEQLEKADAPQCAMKNPDLQTGYAARIPNQGAAVCEFNNGTPLFVLIVRNGEDTYERHFGRQAGPNIYLRGPTWIMITSLTIPLEAKDVIRRDLGAAG